MPSSTSAKRRRWPWALAGLFLAAWFLPTLAAKTPLLSVLVDRALGPLNGSVVIGRASLGWFSPIQLEELELRDPEGKAVLRVGRMETSRRLWQLLWDRAVLGTIHLTEVRADLVLEKGNFNLERLLEPLLEKMNRAEPASQPGPSLTVDIKGLTLTLAESAKTPGVLADLEVTLALNVDAAKPMDLRIRCPGGTGNRLDLALFNEVTAPASSGLPWNLEIETQDFALDPLEPALKRMRADLGLGGSLTGKAVLQWGAHGKHSRFALESSLTWRRARLELPGLEEPLQLAEAKLPWKINLDGQRITFDDTRIQCDLGQGRLHGSLDLEAGWSDLVQTPALDLGLDLDLAAIARRLPRTLRLHENLELTSGRCQLGVSSQRVGQDLHWRGTFMSRDLAGKRAGKPIAWAEPVLAEVQVQVFSHGKARLERLDCRSDFLVVRGEGDAGDLRLRGEADLGRLSAQLGQFVDLSALRLAGQTTFRVAMKHSAPEKFQAQFEAQLRDMHLEWSPGYPWKEKEAILKAEAFLVEQKGRWEMQKAKAYLECGPDRAQAELTTPATSANWGAWKLALNGDLGRWQRRLELATGGWEGWQLSGMGDVQGLLSFPDGDYQVDDLLLTARDAGLRGVGLRISEPTLRLEGQGRYNGNKLACKVVRLRCPTVNADGADVSLSWSPTWELRGGFALAGDIARLPRWFQTTPASVPATGTAIGQLGLRWQGDDIHFDTNLTLQNLVYGPPTQPYLREPALKVQARGSWEGDRVLLERFHLESKLLTCAAAGKVDGLSGAAHIDLKGSLAYDLKQWEPLFKSYLGKDALAAGRGKRDFFLHGPLGTGPQGAFRQLRGEAGLHWDRLEAFRCAVGPAEIKMVLEEGTLRLNPIDTSLNEGRLRLKSDLRLSPEPAEIRMPRGIVIDRARLTPAMCGDALGYALPALANVSEVEGLVSFDLEHARIPLHDPAQAEVKGALSLHDARLGPSPLLRELSLLFKGPGAARLRKETRVPIHMVNGKVHHQDLELLFPSWSVRTGGWVSLEGTMALVVEMPVQSAWVGGDRIGKALEGKQVRVPLKGTLASPKLDQKAFQAALGQMMRETSGAVLFGEVEDRLKKLLGPR